MSIAAVAKKDFQDAIRSRLIVAVTLLFVVFTASGVALGEAWPGVPSGAFLVLLLEVLLAGIRSVVPLIAIGIAYRSIAGERTTGSLKVLLSLPNSRRDVILGKFFGRSAVVIVAIVAGFVSLVVASALTFSGDLPAAEIFAAMGAALLLALVFVSIAISVSALSDSTFFVAVLAFALWILFRMAWTGVVFLLQYAVNGFSFSDIPTEAPEWVQVLEVLNPMIAFLQSTEWLVNRVSESQEAAAGADAFYLEPWFGFVTMALWIIVPLALGYVKFEAADL